MHNCSEHETTTVCPTSGAITIACHCGEARYFLPHKDGALRLPGGEYPSPETAFAAAKRFAKSEAQDALDAYNHALSELRHAQSEQKRACTLLAAGLVSPSEALAQWEYECSHI